MSFSLADDLAGLKGVTNIFEQNETLRKLREDEARRKKNSVDAWCQTDLTTSDIDELVKASLALQKYKERQLEEILASNQQHQRLNYHLPPKHSTPARSLYPRQQPQAVHNSKQNEQLQHQIFTQVHNLRENLPKQRHVYQQPERQMQLRSDEKDILSVLYQIDGTMLTSLHKLRAKTGLDINQI